MLATMSLQPAQLSLFCTVALLVVTAYFLLGSIPLLTLKHDNPVDSRFIRTFYLTYYRLALVAAIAATVTYAMASRPGFAAGAAGIVVLTWALRRRIIPRMDALGERAHADADTAIPAFRAIHKQAILINLGQLVGILASLGAL